MIYELRKKKFVNIVGLEGSIPGQRTIYLAILIRYSWLIVEHLVDWSSSRLNCMSFVLCTKGANDVCGGAE
jgi:hypothetical protein